MPYLALCTFIVQGLFLEYDFENFPKYSLTHLIKMLLYFEYKSCLYIVVKKIAYGCSPHVTLKSTFSYTSEQHISKNEPNLHCSKKDNSYNLLYVIITTII